jgi:hypothetical protein
MRKVILSIFLLSLVLAPCVFADSDIDSEMQKLTHYAKEYEVGNINYVQLMIYVSAVREGMNEILGVTSREFGGVVEQEDIENVFGEPNEETKWVWVEGEDHDMKLDDYVPIWKRIVFDGKKVQIRMEAHPSIFKKRKFEDGKEKFSGLEDGALIYRLNFNTEFKRPEKEFDIEGKIFEIQSLAEDFNEEPSNSNAEQLAKESVNAERIFQNYFMQGQAGCEDTMKLIFGSENQRETQNVVLNELVFFEGEDFEVKFRFEMCDDCEWNWIHLNMWIEGRGHFGDYSKVHLDDMEAVRKKYRHMSNEQLKSEVKGFLEEIKGKLEVRDFEGAFMVSQELQELNNAWNEKSNDVWEEVRIDFDKEFESMSDEERYEFDQNYGWIKQDQKQRQAMRALQESNYEERKNFYLDLFSGYDKKEFYFTQTEFQKRLVEEFKEKGEEICSNNVDDNDNEQVDCDDSQCGGKICGKGMESVTEGNITKDVEVDFYCIQQICQAKEEIDENGKAVCGNHICEEGEENSVTQNGTCQEDCTFEMCPVHDAIECSGKVIFEGEDENGCSLPPICIEEEKECFANEDCAQPSCGVAECVKEDDVGICKITELTECEMECESWL